MAIEVTCSGCLTRFQVSEKFAGKKGPCPKCKALILIPEKAEEVVVHAPVDSGPKDSKGVSVLKPLLRQETKLSRMMIVGIALGVVAVLGAALALRFTIDKKQDNTLILAIGAILLAPPLSYAGYSFLRNDELEPHRGRELWMRLLATSVVYPLTWGLYAALFLYLGYDKTQPELMYMFFAVPAMLALGALACAASLDFEFGTGALHYSLYLAVTIFLRLLIGISAHWQVVAK